MKRFGNFFCLCTLICAALTAHAETYPSRPLRIIVPFPPGGTSDATARLIGQQLAERWKYPVVIDNRGGAGGTIAASIAARSAPDGYTLFMGSHGTQAINVSLFRELPYDPRKDFRAISLALTVPNLFLVHPGQPYKSMQDLIATAKAKPGSLNFAASGLGSMPHMTIELLNYMAGIKTVVVQYKGSGPAMIDVLSGAVPLMSEAVLTSLTHYQARRLRAIGITSRDRYKVVPEIATVAEQGVPGYEGITWVGLLVPAATPDALVKKLNAEIVSILNSEPIQSYLGKLGATPGGGTPQAFDAYIRSETEKWGKVVRAAGLTAQ
jgi:tripartite-type tricarboxylate transporter receptor subunit TctC